MIEIIQGNALLCPNLGVDADCMIVDPPYAEHVHANAVSAGTGGAGVRARDFGFAPVSDALRRTVAGYTAQVRRWSVIYCDLESTHLWRAACESAGSEYIRQINWVRWTQPQMSGDRPPSGAEAVLLFHRAERSPRGRIKPIAKRWNGPGSLTALEHKAERGDTKHPTAKPLDQLLSLVSWLSDPGELVIDPCGGDGTTPLACRLLDRDCLALERAEPWVGSARARVAGVPQLRERDAERVRCYVETTCEEASRVPYPRKQSELRTWERAQRRLADVPRVAANLED